MTWCDPTRAPGGGQQGSIYRCWFGFTDIGQHEKQALFGEAGSGGHCQRSSYTAPEAATTYAPRPWRRRCYTRSSRARLATIVGTDAALAATVSAFSGRGKRAELGGTGANMANTPRIAKALAFLTVLLTPNPLSLPLGACPRFLPHLCPPPPF